MKQTFYICRHCGNLVEMIQDSGVPLVCCGEAMQPLLPNTVEASGEKHLPAVAREDGALYVRVGSAAHPMLEEHFIRWICVVTENGIHRRVLRPGDEPEACFSLGDDKPIAVYAYCNLHGLWMTQL